MCFSTPKDNSAQIARQNEAERQARINTGTASIDQQFAQFDDPYFQNIQQSALDFYNPDLTKQYYTTRESLTKNLARSGNLAGSAGAKRFGDLEEEYARQQAAVADKSRGIATSARADVDSNRSNLISQLSSTADPFAAATAARAAASQLSAPQQFSPIGNLFQNFTGNVAQQAAAAREGYSNPVGRTLGIKPAPGVLTYVN